MAVEATVGRRLSGVEFINPFAADAPARLAALLDT